MIAKDYGWWCPVNWVYDFNGDKTMVIFEIWDVESEEALSNILNKHLQWHLGISDILLFWKKIVRYKVEKK